MAISVGSNYGSSVPWLHNNKFLIGCIPMKWQWSNLFKWIEVVPSIVKILRLVFVNLISQWTSNSWLRDIMTSLAHGTRVARIVSKKCTTHTIDFVPFKAPARKQAPIHDVGMIFPLPTDLKIEFSSWSIVNIDLQQILSCSCRSRIEQVGAPQQANTHASGCREKKTCTQLMYYIKLWPNTSKDKWCKFLAMPSDHSAIHPMQLTIRTTIWRSHAYNVQHTVWGFVVLMFKMHTCTMGSGSPASWYAAARS